MVALISTILCTYVHVCVLGEDIYRFSFGILQNDSSYSKPGILKWGLLQLPCQWTSTVHSGTEEISTDGLMDRHSALLKQGSIFKFIIRLEQVPNTIGKGALRLQICVHSPKNVLSFSFSPVIATWVVVHRCLWGETRDPVTFLISGFWILKLVSVLKLKA